MVHVMHPCVKFT